MHSSLPTQSVDVRVNDQGLRLTFLVREGQGRAIILIHGMGSSRLAFWSLLQAFPLPNPVYALDLPGFGGSTLPHRRQGLNDYVQAVFAFAAALHLIQPTLVGHSFGGMVAAETAISRPDQIFGVFLVSSAGWIYPQNVMQPTPSVLFNRIGIWITGSDWIGKKMIVGLGRDPLQISREERARMSYGWRHAREMARMGRFYETEAMALRLQQSKVPAVALAGDRDPLFPLSQVKAAVGDRVPLWVIKGAGHLPIEYDLAQFQDRLVEAITFMDSENRQRSEGQ